MHEPYFLCSFFSKGHSDNLRILAIANNPLMTTVELKFQDPHLKMSLLRNNIELGTILVNKWLVTKGRILYDSIHVKRLKYQMYRTRKHNGNYLGQ